jgi:hypothetical protein
LAQPSFARRGEAKGAEGGEMNRQIQPYQQVEQFEPDQVQTQWVELIVPVMNGIMLLVFVAGMVRNIVKGEKVELPL